MRLDWGMLPGLKVTIMGLGLHGGGATSAAFFARHGARVTVTDLRSEAELAGSVAALAGLDLRFVLGRHEEEDFSGADLVIKNPAVPTNSPYLAAARRIETDISVFLALAANPIIAVTGTKGKSTTSAAIHSVLQRVDPRTRLGGNITVSPLSFVDELREEGGGLPVVLELSSWQLGDLRGSELLRPRVAVVTNILPDHQNRYAGMDDYVADKVVIGARQGKDDFGIYNYDDPYVTRFSGTSPATPRYFSRSRLPEHLDGAWIDGGRGVIRSGGSVRELVGRGVALPGEHNLLNLIAAGLALSCLEIEAATIADGLSEFRGIRHRLEFVAEIDGRRYYNDSAATIPEATVAAVGSFEAPVILIAGGTDKKLDFEAIDHLRTPPRLVVLLAGSATPKLEAALRRNNIPVTAPVESLEAAIRQATAASQPGDVILLSPGAASFELFANEFDRGDSFVRAVRAARPR